MQSTLKADTLGSRLRKLRKIRKLTIAELSKLSGVPCTTIRYYERDLIEPTFFKLCCIAKVLKVSLDYLAGWSDDITRTS